MAQMTENMWVFWRYYEEREISSGINGKLRDVLKFMSTLERYLCVELWWLGESLSRALGLFMPASSLYHRYGRNCVARKANDRDSSGLEGRVK